MSFISTLNYLYIFLGASKYGTLETKCVYYTLAKLSKFSIDRSDIRSMTQNCLFTLNSNLQRLTEILLRKNGNNFESLSKIQNFELISTSNSISNYFEERLKHVRCTH